MEQVYLTAIAKVFTIDVELGPDCSDISDVACTSNLKFHSIAAGEVDNELFGRIVIMSSSKDSFDVRTMGSFCEGKASDVYKLNCSSVKVSMIICSQHIQRFEIKKDVHSALNG